MYILFRKRTSRVVQEIDDGNGNKKVIFCVQNVGTHTRSVSPFIFLKKRRTYRDFFKTYRKNLENERNEHYTRTRYTTHKRLGGFAPYTMKNDIHVETHRFIKETFVLCRVVPF